MQVIIDPCSLDAPPRVLSGVPAVVCAGQEFSVEVFNARPFAGAEAFDVAFTDGPGGELEIHGLVTDVSVRFDQNLRCDVHRVTVIAPSGIPDGILRLVIAREDGSLVEVPGPGIRGCPEIVGFTSGDIFLVPSDVGVDYQLISSPNPVDTSIALYGRNLERVTSAVVVAGTPQPGFATTSANFVGLDDEWTAVEFDLQGTPGIGGFQFTPAFDHDDVTVVARDETATPTLSSNRITVPFRRQYVPPTTPSLPATICAAFVRPGIHQGAIDIEFVLAARPSTAYHDVAPEFLDPADSEWKPCTPAPDSPEGFMSGPSSAQVPRSFVPAGGALHRFRWDSTADVFGDPVAVPLRIPLEMPLLFGAGSNSFPTATLPDTHFELAPVVVSNPDPGASATGTGNIYYEIYDNPTSSPMSVADGRSVYGEGTFHLTLTSDHEYRIDTDVVGIFARPVGSSDPEQVVFPEIGDPNPGNDYGEFHVASLDIEDGTSIELAGSAPLIVRVSGDGDPDEPICALGSTLISARAAPANFRTGILGGSDGGVGGTVTPGSATSLDTVALVEPSRPGARGGGESGESILTSYSSNFRLLAGGGGGGGSARAGESASSQSGSYSPTVAGRAGRGGAAVQAPLGLRIVGGTGGGGGGAASSSIATRSGGSGGAGGGAIAFFVNGDLDVGSVIDVRGQFGESVPAPPPSVIGGPGGGGGGGQVVLASEGDLTFLDTATILAEGGFGGAGELYTVNRRGGDGSPGRVQLFTNSQFSIDAVSTGGGVLPPVSGSDAALVIGSQASLSPLIGGPGGPDIVLDEPPIMDGSGNIIATHVFDTSAGTLSNPDGTIAVFANGNPFEYRFANFTIGEDAVVRVVGNRALVIRCSGTFELAGELDVSGQNGGLPSSALSPGVGGLPGPGGGAGGAGGVGGVDGEYSSLAHIVSSPIGNDDPSIPPDAVAIPGGILASKGGESGTNGDVGLVAGGGGGGGFRFSGEAVPTPAGSLDNGYGGSAYGDAFFSYYDSSLGQIVVATLGGSGGGGGGGVAQTQPSSGSPLPPVAGTGGGGGGGFLRVATSGELRMTETGRILARGGDAFAAPERAGNGGAGAGGAVYLQSLLGVELLGTIDLRGGVANRTDGLPYPASSIAGGGNGSRGRLRIEAPNGFAVLFPAIPEQTDVQLDYRAGGREWFIERTRLVSLVSTGGAVLNGELDFTDPVIYTDAPDPEDVQLIHFAAFDDPESPGSPAEFIGPFTDLGAVPVGARWIQTEIHRLVPAGSSFSVRGLQYSWSTP